MIEPNPANLPRLLMRCALFLLSVVFGIFGTSAVLHASALTFEDLMMLLPSVLLILAPYLMGAIEAAWNLSLFGSAIITVLVACLCTALFFFGLGSFSDSGASTSHGDVKPAIQEVRPAG